MKTRNKINQILFLGIILLGKFSFTSCSDEETSAMLPVVEVSQSEAGPIAIDHKEVLKAGGYSYSYIVKLDRVADKPLLCDIVVDESLVDSYNALHQTSYKLMPSTVYSLPSKNVIIKANELESNTVSVAFNSLYGLASGEEYLLPVVTALDENCTGFFTVDNRSVAFFSISIDKDIDYIPGLKMSTYSTDMYRTLNFVNNEVVEIEGNTHTFEMLIYPFNWHSGTNYIAAWRGKDLNRDNEDFSGCEFKLRGASYANAAEIVGRQCDLATYSYMGGIMIPVNKWTRITVTCDGTLTGQNVETAYRLYINGEEKAAKIPSKYYGPSSREGTEVGYSFTGIKFGNSSGDYFDGLISDIRMWKKCLTPEEIKANLREINSPTSTDLYGYWKIDEGKGNILKDCSGHGRDLIFPNSAKVVWNAEINDLLEE